MSLELDERRRAMLAEMGVRVFAPPGLAGADAAVLEQSAQAPQVRQAPPVRQMPAPPQPVTARASPATGVQFMDWAALAQAVAEGSACKLCSGRGRAVFGVGGSNPDWLIVGDAPDEGEQAQGEPFVGDAGTLLNNMLRACGLDRRGKVFITHALKCRPPGGRNPTPEELADCEPVLRRQAQLLQPRVILAMGRFAVQALLGSSEPVGKLRGRAHQYEGVPVVVTYHPSYLLRNLPDKARAWADLCLAQQLTLGQS
jgi:uracil-DNA glycosylase family 4